MPQPAGRVGPEIGVERRDEGRKDTTYVLSLISSGFLLDSWNRRRGRAGMPQIQPTKPGRKSARAGNSNSATIIRHMATTNGITPTMTSFSEPRSRTPWTT